MNRNEWILVLTPLFITWYLDRITKLWALDLVGIQSWGWIHFTLHYNPGALLGLFSDLPPLLRIVSLSTGGAFLVCTYVLLQYLLPIKSILLRSGMSFLLGGILGNVTDRILWGHVVDFVAFGSLELTSPFFNLADALQWVGYGLIVSAIIKDGEILWPEFDVRKQYWVNMKFQLKYCYILMAVGFGISLIAMVFSFTYLRVTMVSLIGNDQQILDKFLLPFVFTFLLVSLGIGLSLFTIGKIISHKIAGPIYAFEKYARELMDAADPEQIRQFRLREKDEFRNLEDLATRMREHYVSHKNSITKSDIQDFT